MSTTLAKHTLQYLNHPFHVKSQEFQPGKQAPEELTYPMEAESSL